MTSNCNYVGDFHGIGIILVGSFDCIVITYLGHLYDVFVLGEIMSVDEKL